MDRHCFRAYVMDLTAKNIDYIATFIFRVKPKCPDETEALFVGCSDNIFEALLATTICVIYRTDRLPSYFVAVELSHIGNICSYI